METIDESDYEDQRSDNSEPEWMKEYPSEEESPEEVLQPTRRSDAVYFDASRGSGGPNTIPTNTWKTI